MLPRKLPTQAVRRLHFAFDNFHGLASGQCIAQPSGTRLVSETAIDDQRLRTAIVIDLIERPRIRNRKLIDNLSAARALEQTESVLYRLGKRLPEAL